MENTRTRESMFKQIENFFKSFVEAEENFNDGKVNPAILSTEEKTELARVLKADGGNTEKIEKAMRERYRAKVNTDKAKKVANKKGKNNKEKVIEK